MEAGRGMYQIAHKAGVKASTIMLSIVDGWNLIGYSSNETNLSLSGANFTDDDETEYTWAQALSNNKQKAYLNGKSQVTIIWLFVNRLALVSLVWSKF
jgi:hypothetical protein